MPNSSNTTSEKGDLQSIDSTGRLVYHNGSTSSNLVTSDSTDVLINKTLTSPAINGGTLTGTLTSTGTISGGIISGATISGGALTPTSLTVKDGTFIVQNTTTPTKQIKFDLSTLSTVSTRIFQVPNSDDILVGTNVSQTLLNKTIQNGSISLCGITATDANFFIANSGNLTKIVAFSLAGISAATTRTLTVPNVDMTLSGRDNSETLTNKTINTSSNTIKSGTALSGEVLTADGAGNTSWENSVSILPPGMMMPYAGSSIPVGWLDCDGSSVATATYPNLFATIGYTWGGAGANFNLPDIRGRTLLGAGTGVGLTARTLGQQNIGEENHILSTAELASHIHGSTVSLSSAGAHTHSVPQGAYTPSTGAFGLPGDSFVPGTQGWAAPQTTGSSGAHTHPISMSIFSEGNSDGHNTMQPSAVVKYIIKI